MSIVWFNFVKDNKKKFQDFYEELNKSNEEKLNKIAQKCLQSAIEKESKINKKQKESESEQQENKEMSDNSKKKKESSEELFVESKTPNKNFLKKNGRIFII